MGSESYVTLKKNTNRVLMGISGTSTIYLYKLLFCFTVWQWIVRMFSCAASAIITFSIFIMGWPRMSSPFISYMLIFIFSICAVFRRHMRSVKNTSAWRFIYCEYSQHMKECKRCSDPEWCLSTETTFQMVLSLLCLMKIPCFHFWLSFPHSFFWVICIKKNGRKLRDKESIQQSHSMYKSNRD